MCVDFAIHDKGDGNPHAHVMLTMRAMDEHGKWLPKSRKVYDLDESGERIKLPSGRWKSHKEDTVIRFKFIRSIIQTFFSAFLCCILSSNLIHSMFGDRLSEFVHKKEARTEN